MNVTKESTVEEVFEYTGETFEESGSRIQIYNCKLCGHDVASYSKSSHLWYHKYLKGLIT